MKKYALLLLLSIKSLAVAACTDCMMCPYLLDIYVQNNTNTICHLVQHTINKGVMYDKDISYILLPKAESKVYRFEDADRDAWIGSKNKAVVEVMLSFFCGQDKFATLVSRKNISYPNLLHWYYEVEGNILSLSNIEANFEKTEAICKKYSKKLQPIALHWTLS